MNFCINGLIFPDRTVHPAMLEVRKLFQPVRVQALDLENGWIEISNRYDFSTLGAFAWDLGVNAGWRSSAKRPAARFAHRPRRIRKNPHSFDVRQLDQSGETWLMLRFTLAEDASWAKAGHQVAWEQLKLPFPDPRASTVHPAVSPLAVQETSEKVQIGSADFVIEFDRATGKLIRYELAGNRPPPYRTLLECLAGSDR